MTTLEKIKEIEEVLGCGILTKEADRLYEDWKAFYEEPKKYKGTIVVALVKNYLNIE